MTVEDLQSLATKLDRSFFQSGNLVLWLSDLIGILTVIFNGTIILLLRCDVAGASELNIQRKYDS